MASNYVTGEKAKKQIIDDYKAKGWTVTEVKKGGGSSDLTCVNKKTGVKHFVQVKGTAVDGKKDKLSKSEAQKLKTVATKNNGTAVFATVNSNGEASIGYAKANRRVKI